MNKTNANFTSTAIGDIPHIRIVGSVTVDCPVKVHPQRDMSKLHYPAHDDCGRLVYALPGGGERTSLSPDPPMIKGRYVSL